MRTLNFEQMQQVEAGDFSSGFCKGSAMACGAGVMALKVSFAIPVLFAFVAPLTVGACAGSVACAAT